MIRESECVSPRNTFLIYADDDQGLSKCLLAKSKQLYLFSHAIIHRMTLLKVHVLSLSMTKYLYTLFEDSGSQIINK